MLKKMTLMLKSRIALKYNKVRRTTPDFESARSIGILIKDIHKHTTLIKKIIKELEAEGKKVHILSYEKNKKDIAQGIKYDIITKKDVSLMGNFKSFAIKKFIKTDFDYLFSLNTSSFLLFENILARCSAKCRVGIFNENKKEYFEMMIHPGKENSLGSLAEQMIFYTRLIK